MLPMSSSLDTDCSFLRINACDLPERYEDLKKEYESQVCLVCSEIRRPQAHGI